MFFPVRDVYNELQWSPHGSLLGAVGERELTIYDQGQRMRICRSATREMPSYGLTCLAWCPVRHKRETLVAFGGREGVVRIWNVSSEEELRVYSEHSPEIAALPAVFYPHRRTIHALAWSPDGQFLASAAEDGAVRIWQAETGKTVFVSEQEPMRGGSFLAWIDQQTVVSNWGSELVIWEAFSGSVMRTISTRLAWDGHAFALSPTRTHLAVATGVEVTIYHLLTGTICQTYRPHTLLRSDPASEGIPSPVSWSPDGHYLATIFDNAQNRIFIWDARSNETIHEHRHFTPITCLAWAFDSSTLAWAGHGYLTTGDMLLPSASAPGLLQNFLPSGTR